MGKYYVSVKYRRLMALITTLTSQYGYEFKPGGKHNKLIAPSGKSISVPHKHGYSSAATIESICKSLLKEGIDDEVISKHLLK